MRAFHVLPVRNSKTSNLTLFWPGLRKAGTPAVPPIDIQRRRVGDVDNRHNILTKCKIFSKSLGIATVPLKRWVPCWNKTRNVCICLSYIPLILSSRGHSHITAIFVSSLSFMLHFRSHTDYSKRFSDCRFQFQPYPPRGLPTKVGRNELKPKPAGVICLQQGLTMPYRHWWNPGMKLGEFMRASSLWTFSQYDLIQMKGLSTVLVTLCRTVTGAACANPLNVTSSNIKHFDAPASQPVRHQQILHKCMSA